MHYYEALQKIAKALNSSATLNEVLNLVVTYAAQGLNASACSLLVLDSTRKKLVHSVSSGLSETYLHKGLLDAEKSLGEVLQGKPVVIPEAATDPRIEHPELAAQAKIASILAVPLAIKSDIVGEVRVYTRQRRDFTPGDIDFLTSVADLCALALERAQAAEEAVSEARVKPSSLLHQVTPHPTFAHPSEEEFARLLDFYQVEWVYEPHSFPLSKEGERVTEMFTPDFYLPGLDLYVELTTLKQSLVTEKNRKLRRLRELYPNIKIRLLYKKDYHRLLAKYGFGPLGEARGQGLGRVLFSASRIQKRVRELARQISQDYAGRKLLLVGVLRGVVCFMADLMRHIPIPVELDFMAISYYGSNSEGPVKITKDLDRSITGWDVLMVEDIVDTGMTLSYTLHYLRARQPASLAVCTFLDKRVRRLVEVPLTYVGFEVPDEFVVGYGLDYGEEYRNLPFIATLSPEAKETKTQKQAHKPKKSSARRTSSVCGPGKECPR